MIKENKTGPDRGEPENENQEEIFSLQNKISIKREAQEQNKRLLRGSILETTNAQIDEDIAELNRQLEQLGVKEEISPEIGVEAIEDRRVELIQKVDTEKQEFDEEGELTPDQEQEIALEERGGLVDISEKAGVVTQKTKELLSKELGYIDIEPKEIFEKLTPKDLDELQMLMKGGKRFEKLEQELVASRKELQDLEDTGIFFNKKEKRKKKERMQEINQEIKKKEKEIKELKEEGNKEEIITFYKNKINEIAVSQGIEEKLTEEKAEEIAKNLQETIQQTIDAQAQEVIAKFGLKKFGKMAGGMIKNMGLMFGAAALIGTLGIATGGAGVVVMAGGMALTRLIEKKISGKIREEKAKKTKEKFKQKLEKEKDKVLESFFKAKEKLREKMSGVMSNEIRRQTSKEASALLREYRDAKVSGNTEIIESNLTELEKEFYLSALTKIKAEHPKIKDEEQQHNMAIQMAMNLAQYERGEIEGKKRLEDLKKDKPKVYKLVQKFNLLRSGVTDKKPEGMSKKETSLWNKYKYDLTSLGVGTAIGMAVRTSELGRVAFGALGGVGMGYMMGEAVGKRAEKKGIKEIEKMIDQAEEVIEDISFPANELPDLRKNATLVQSRLELGLLDVDPVLKSRAENFIHNVRQVEFANQKTLNKLLEQQENNNKKLEKQVEKDVTRIEKKTKRRRILAMVGGGLAGGLAAGAFTETGKDILKDIRGLGEEGPGIEPRGPGSIEGGIKGTPFVAAEFPSAPDSLSDSAQETYNHLKNIIQGTEGKLGPTLVRAQAEDVAEQLKTAAPEQWEEILENYKSGDVVEETIKQASSAPEAPVPEPEEIKIALNLEKPGISIDESAFAKEMPELANELKELEVSLKSFDQNTFNQIRNLTELTDTNPVIRDQALAFLKKFEEGAPQLHEQMLNEYDKTFVPEAPAPETPGVSEEVTKPSWEQEVGREEFDLEKITQEQFNQLQENLQELGPTQAKADALTLMEKLKETDIDKYQKMMEAHKTGLVEQRDELVKELTGERPITPPEAAPVEQEITILKEPVTEETIISLEAGFAKEFPKLADKLIETGHFKVDESLDTFDQSAFNEVQKLADLTPETPDEEVLCGEAKDFLQEFEKKLPEVHERMLDEFEKIVPDHKASLIAERDALIDELTGETTLAVEHLDYQGGNSVWREVENQLQGRAGFKDLFTGGDEAEQTHAIDYFKDKIVANPQEYGLAEAVDPDELTPEHLKSVDWDKLLSVKEGEIDKAFPNLTEEAKQNIIENNRILQEYVSRTGEALDTDTVDQILEDVKEAGGVDEYLKPEEIVRPEEVEQPEPVDLSGMKWEDMTPAEQELLENWGEYLFIGDRGRAAEAAQEAAKDFLDSQPPEVYNKYSDVKEVIQYIRMDDLNEGLFNRGADTEDLMAGVQKLAETHDLSDTETKLFSNWLAGEDGILKKNDFRHVITNKIIDPEKFSDEIQFFKEGYGGSEELPDTLTWEPRHIYTGEGADRIKQLVNIRAVEGGCQIDSTGDGMPDQDVVHQRLAVKQMMSKEVINTAEA